MTSPSYRPNADRVPAGTATIIVNFAALRVLLLRRTGAHGAGTWGTPGGWLEAGERPVRGACREVWEEVGLNVDADSLDLVGVTNTVFPEGVTSVCLWYTAYRWIGEARNTNPDRITEIEWWPYRALYERQDELFLGLQQAINEPWWPCR